MKYIIATFVLAVGIQGNAGENTQSSKKSQEKQAVTNSMFEKISLRSFMAVASIGKTPEEVDGVMMFAKRNRINLNQRINLSIIGKSVFLNKKEIKFDSRTGIVNYAGLSFKPASKQLDVLVHEIDRKINPGLHSMLSILISSAYAQDVTTGDVISEVQSVGGTILALGYITSKTTAQGSFGLVAGKLAMRAGFATWLSGGLLQAVWPSPAEAGEIVRITDSRCDRNGFMIQKNVGGMLEIKKIDGILKVFIDGKVVNDSVIRENPYLRNAQSVLAECEMNPVPRNEFTVSLQNALEKEYKMAINAAPTSPLQSTSPGAGTR